SIARHETSARSETSPARGVAAIGTTRRRYSLAVVASLVAAAAAIGFVAGFGGRDSAAARRGAPGASSNPRVPSAVATKPASLAEEEMEQPVQFVLRAPGAGRVALVGDFNGWDTSRSPMREERPGVWSVTLPLKAGRHVYAFVV